MKDYKGYVRENFLQKEVFNQKLGKEEVINYASNSSNPHPDQDPNSPHQEDEQQSPELPFEEPRPLPVESSPIEDPEILTPAHELHSGYEQEEEKLPSEVTPSPPRTLRRTDTTLSSISIISASEAELRSPQVGNHKSTSTFQMIKTYEEDSEIDRLKFTSLKESSLVAHLKGRDRQNKRLTQNGQPCSGDNFSLVRKCLAPMKKKRVLQSLSKSRRSSKIQSISNPDTKPPTQRVYSNTQKFYKNEMLNEIRTYIFSQLRFKIFISKYK